MQIASLRMKTAFWRPVIWANGRPVLRALGEGAPLGVSMRLPYSSRLSVRLRDPCSRLTGSVVGLLSGHRGGDYYRSCGTAAF